MRMSQYHDMMFCDLQNPYHFPFQSKPHKTTGKNHIAVPQTAIKDTATLQITSQIILNHLLSLSLDLFESPINPTALCPCNVDVLKQAQHLASI